MCGPWFTERLRPMHSELAPPRRRLSGLQSREGRARNLVLLFCTLARVPDRLRVLDMMNRRLRTMSAGGTPRKPIDFESGFQHTKKIITAHSRRWNITDFDKSIRWLYCISRILPFTCKAQACPRRWSHSFLHVFWWISCRKMFLARLFQVLGKLLFSDRNRLHTAIDHFTYYCLGSTKGAQRGC